MRRPSRPPRFGLLARFGVISFVLLVVLGVVLGATLARSLRERTVSDAVRSAEIAARVGIVPHLRPDDLQRDFVPLDPARLAEVDARLRTSVSESGIVRLKIWNARHWIVYSDNDKLVGRWFASDPLLDASLDGATTSSVTDLSRPQEMEERSFGTLLAVYVPLRVDAEGEFTEGSTGTVIGAFEVYLPYAPIAAAIERDTQRLWLTVGIGLVVVYLALFRLVAGASRLLRRQAAENERLARSDALTGLANRLGFREQLAARLPNPTAVLLADIDRFQEINATLGHDAGDEVLVVLAERLRRSFGPEVLVGRPGGDEFLVAVPLSGEMGIESELTRLHAALSRSVRLDGLALEISVSVGGAVAPEQSTDVDDLLRWADVAMYHAKATRRGTAVYSAAIDAHTPERLAMAADIRAAIANHEMFLVYQPKLTIDDRQVRGVEALVRWRHPERGVVSPGVFLPLVESTELIRPLTMEVLRQALDQAALWWKAGRELSVAVNLSARVCDDVAIVTSIGRELAWRGLPPEALEVELTESALVQDAHVLAQVLDLLHGMGVSVAIDDFGTGYASVSYLTSLPVDVVKIDREFVHDVTLNRQHSAVVQFTTELGRTFGMKVVAEGVEDIEMLPVLRSLGVDAVQGYAIARPMEAHDFDGWLERHEMLQLTLAADAEGPLEGRMEDSRV